MEILTAPNGSHLFPSYLDFHIATTITITSSVAFTTTTFTTTTIATANITPTTTTATTIILFSPVILVRLRNLSSIGDFSFKQLLPRFHPGHLRELRH